MFNLGEQIIARISKTTIAKPATTTLLVTSTTPSTSGEESKEASADNEDEKEDGSGLTITITISKYFPLSGLSSVSSKKARFLIELILIFFNLIQFWIQPQKRKIYILMMKMKRLN